MQDVEISIGDLLCDKVLYEFVSVSTSEVKLGDHGCIMYVKADTFDMRASTSTYAFQPTIFWKPT